VPFANWKLGRDKKKLSSHRILRQDKTAKLFSFEIVCLQQRLDLSAIQFTPPTQTRQDCLVCVGGVN